MASTEYFDRVTHVEAEWANDADAIVYDIFGAAKTKREARLALGIDNSNVDITGGKINNTTIGLDVQATGWFNWIKINELPIDPLHGTNKRYVDSLFAAGAGGGTFLEHDVPVIGTSVGAVDAGFTFLQGLSFTEFVVLVSTRTIAPTYISPSVNVGTSATYTDRFGATVIQNGHGGTFEIGTLITDLQFSSTFSANDSGGLAAGTPGSFHFFDHGVANPTAPQNAPLVHGVLVDNTETYDIRVDYLQGPIKNNNLGVPDPTGRINAGTVGDPVQLVGYRKLFYGTPNATPTLSAQVRLLQFDVLNPQQNGDVDNAGVSLVPAPNPSFVITIPIGATRVCFAYPNTIRSVASVKYQELSDSEVKGNFVETSVSVAGADGFTAINYRVFTYVPVEPFSLVNHYKVFI